MVIYEAIGTKVWRHVDQEDSRCVAECKDEDEAQEIAITFALQEYVTGKIRMKHVRKLN